MHIRTSVRLLAGSAAQGFGTVTADGDQLADDGMQKGGLTGKGNPALSPKLHRAA
jgi:hypothetical protein